MAEMRSKKIGGWGEVKKANVSLHCSFVLLSIDSGEASGGARKGSGRYGYDNMIKNRK